MRIKTTKREKATYSLIGVFVLLLGCVFVLLMVLMLLVLLMLLVRAKSFRKKKEFKTALMTSFKLLLLSIVVTCCTTGCHSIYHSYVFL